MRFEKIAILASSVALGFTIGYKVAKKQLEVKYADIAEAEGEDWKAHFEKKAADLREQYHDQMVEMSGDALKYAAQAQKAEAALALFNYKGETELAAAAKEVDELFGTVVPAPISSANETFGPRASLKSVPETIEAEPASQNVRKDRVVDKSKPYLTTSDEMLSNEENYAEATLTYYAGDQVLVNEEEEPLDDKSKLLIVGMNLSAFEQMPDDENAIYIRNDRIQTYLEVVRNEGTYAQAVGLGENE